MTSTFKHITFVIPIYLPAALDGSAMVISDLAENLVKQGFQVTVITSDAKTSRSWYDPIFGKRLQTHKSIIHGVKVIRLHTAWFISSVLFVLNKLIGKSKLNGLLVDWIRLLFFGPYFIGLKKVIQVVKPDVLVFCPFPCGFCYSSASIAKQLSIPYVLIPFFKPDNSLFSNPILKTVLREAKGVFAPTVTEQKLLTNMTGYKNVVLLPSSFDYSYVKTSMKQIQKRAKEFQKKMSLQGTTTYLFIGAKGKEKGIFDFVEASKLITDTSARFIIIGLDTPDWIRYRKTIVDARIIERGYLSGVDKYAFFFLCDALVLPSTSDNFPLVFVESWYFKKPIIAYAHYAIPEILSDGSGICVETNNIPKLAQAMKFLKQNPKSIQAIGEIGYSKVNQHDGGRVTKLFIEGLQKFNL
jgi:glycosyltransferase involved in cell wall biosynthesis